MGRMAGHVGAVAGEARQDEGMKQLHLGAGTERKMQAVQFLVAEYSPCMEEADL